MIGDRASRRIAEGALVWGLALLFSLACLVTFILGVWEDVRLAR